MVVSYKIKQTKDNGVASKMRSVPVKNSSPTKPSSTVVAEEFPTPQVRLLQLCETFGGNERGTESCNGIFHLNRPSADDCDGNDLRTPTLCRWMS
jgi:hypothetical protein